MDVNTRSQTCPSSQRCLNVLSALNYVHIHSLLPQNQSAYRRGHSTETALLKVYSDLISALDSSSDNQSVLLVLDMTAAFDTVEHSILLRRLERKS